MKRSRNSSTMETSRPASSNMRHAVTLSCLVFLTVSSTISSFQPSVAQHRDHNNRCYHDAPNTNEAHSWPLHVSSITSEVPPQQLLKDWANRLVPVTPVPTTQRSITNSNIYAPSSADWNRDAELQRRKDEWANRYTNLDSLRETFGSNHNKLWGDLDATTVRRLYKTLLPNALLELEKVGVEPEDLAPLAYQARVAAKLYARERSQAPARLAACMLDGSRQFYKYGKFQTQGMSYDQVWEKYQKAVLEEDVDDLTEQDVTAKICLRILERSCASNKYVDRWVLPEGEDQEQREDLDRIVQTLESDVRKLLDPIALPVPQKTLTLKAYRILRLVARARRRSNKRRNKQQVA